VNGINTPVVTAPPEVAASFDSICGAPDALESLERSSREDDLAGLPFLKSREWSGFAEDVRRAFAERDHLVVRGLPVTNHGATLLLAARTVGTALRTYRGGQIVKQFTMSPWTTELSHTTREGEFHTDLNTESTPPAITAMQCLEPDPGTPPYGLSRVARLKDLLTFLAESGDHETLRFLTQQSVTMLNDRSHTSRSGLAVEEGVIRYHPETLRAAARRAGEPVETLADRIDGVARAALAVSEPFVLGRGDVLLLSNHRTLHYRGECSVVFKRYPTEFVSRSVFILHAGRELSAG
jgi:Taurine catabolism dioxygenase TauD, TfdA family